MPANFLRAALLAGVLASSVAGSALAGRDAQKPLNIGNAGSKSPFNGDVADFVHRVMENWKIPGMAVAVIDDEAVYTQAYGYSTLPDVEATPDTLFFAGSTSKAFAAATLAHMIDSKNYSALAEGWSTPISSIIRDDFVMQDSWSTERISLEDAVSHRTGMPRHDMAWPRFHEDGSKVSTAEMVRRLRHLKPSTAPRTTWQYCNLMFVVLGHIIETVSGKWLGEAIRERVWGPLGMQATFGDTKDAMAAPEQLAAGYYWDAKAGQFQEMRVDSTRESSGAGLVISSVADYSKWVKCLLHETQPFSKKAHQEIRKTHMLMSVSEKTGDGDMTYGLAWMKKTYHGEVVYKHGGTELAYSTQVYWLPRLKYGVVVMANTGAANPAEDEVVWRLIEDKLEVPESQRYNISSSLDEALEARKKALQDLPKMYYPNTPDPVLPSSLTNAQILGKYYDAGYGYLNIFQTEIDGGVTLVANRTDMLTPYEMRFSHTSGNYWLANIYVNDQNATAGAWAAEFKVGVDGEAAGLEIRLTPPGEAIDEGTVWFKRMD